MSRFNLSRVTILAAVLLLATTMTLLQGCKKSQPAVDYPDLIGAWNGSTSQSEVISLSVNYVNGSLWVTSLKITVISNNGARQTIQRYSTDGVVIVPSRSFNLAMGTGTYGPGYIEGTFNPSNNTFTGTFKIYSTADPNDYSSGTFVGSKQK
jgi:hypothetical protein